jgi:hypothetical protein
MGTEVADTRWGGGNSSEPGEICGGIVVAVVQKRVNCMQYGRNTLHSALFEYLI